MAKNQTGKFDLQILNDLILGGKGLVGTLLVKVEIYDKSSELVDNGLLLLNSNDHTLLKGSMFTVDPSDLLLENLGSKEMDRKSIRNLLTAMTLVKCFELLNFTQSFILTYLYDFLQSKKFLAEDTGFLENWEQILVTSSMLNFFEYLLTKFSSEKPENALPL